MTKLHCVHNQPEPVLANFDERQLARYLLLRLNPQREGDLIPLIGTAHDRTDVDVLVRWIRRHHAQLDWPLRPDACYERVLSDIREALEGPL